MGKVLIKIICKTRQLNEIFQAKRCNLRFEPITKKAFAEEQQADRQGTVAKLFDGVNEQVEAFFRTETTGGA